MKKLIFAFILCFSLSLNAQKPTWADDVACIMYSHCTSCHNPNGSGPFSLLDFSDAVSLSSGIKYQVENKLMPPWPVDNNYRRMAHERNLSDAEKNTILAWINNGATQGNMANAPTPPVYNSALVITNPDLKLRLPTYTVPAITEDLYRCFVLQQVSLFKNSSQVLKLFQAIRTLFTMHKYFMTPLVPPLF